MKARSYIDQEDSDWDCSEASRAFTPRGTPFRERYQRIYVSDRESASQQIRSRQFLQPINFQIRKFCAGSVGCVSCCVRICAVIAVLATVAITAWISALAATLHSKVRFQECRQAEKFCLILPDLTPWHRGLHLPRL